MNKSLLIIGKPHASKSVFIAQFYTRLQKKKSKLTLYDSVKDLTPINETRDALARGEEPEPTHTNKNVNMLLPISFGGEQIDLLCPDYGGEQINKILQNRAVDKKWVEAIENSESWLFFIRLASVCTAKDISGETVTDDYPEKGRSDENTYEYVLSDQSAFIELLQILLSFKNHNYHVKNKQVKLTVVLTCWDELGEVELPAQELKEFLPLLYSFIHANWVEECIKIVGLSAQGFPLNIDKNSEKYQIEGPENFGYFVKADGTRTKDITELIIEAI